MRRTALFFSLAAGLGFGVVPANAGQPLNGAIRCDGSSTVYLITEAMATAFKKQHPNVRISVGISGTGGGFKKFAAGETDISDASRRVKPAEAEACQKNGIKFTEFQVAWDGLTVVIHPENTWARKMTVAQLKKIWHPDTAARRWSDVDPTWPEEEIVLFGPGPDSGTFDFFTEAINGKERVSRRDYQASEDDNTIVKGVAGSQYAMGYFGYAYFEENQRKVSAVAVAEKPGAEHVLPSSRTVLTQRYQPLSRPLFIYVRNDSLERPEVREFVRFYLRRPDLVKNSKFISLNARGRIAQQDKLENTIKRARAE